MGGAAGAWVFVSMLFLGGCSFFEFHALRGLASIPYVANTPEDVLGRSLVWRIHFARFAGSYQPDHLTLK